MATKTKAHVTINLDDVRNHGSVEKAIAAWCEDSDTTSCGVIGSSFSTSGPGPGWSMNHDENDYASRAFEGGAVHYIDATDGRMKSADMVGLNEDDEDDDTIQHDIAGCAYREGKWSSESVVRIECPSLEEAIEETGLVAEMAQSVIDHHYDLSDKAEWKNLIETIREVAEWLEDIDTDALDE
jgi:hypothetical protein